MGMGRFVEATKAMNSPETEKIAQFSVGLIAFQTNRVNPIQNNR